MHEAGHDIRTAVEAASDAIVDALVEWVRIPSVAAEPERAPELRRSASWLAGALRDVGFPLTEIWDGEQGPAVFAEWCEAPDAPTVLVYSHHDVRAAKDENWDETAPFEPVVRDGRLYGRGGSDAKGQVIAHLWAVRAHLQTTGRAAPAVNLKLLVEGEEEVGSPSLSSMIDAHRDRLDADVVVYSDTLLWHAEHPAVCTSIRGTLTARLEVLGPLTDVHSGAVSGPAPNPAIELGRLLGELHDVQGRITIGGFYDDVAPISEERRAELAALPFDREDWLSRSHTRSIVGEAGFSVLERLWERPSLEVIGLAAGDPGSVKRAAVPSMAAADLSIRTTAGQRVGAVAEQLRRWCDEHVGAAFEHRLTVDEPIAQECYRTPPTPVLDALARSMAKGFGVAEAGRMGNAGGGPADLLATRLDAPVVFFGTGLVEDNWHDSDESVSLAMVRAGAATLAHLWLELGAGLSRG